MPLIKKGVLILDMSCAASRFNALRFIENQVDFLLLSIPHKQISSEERNDELQSLAHNVRSLEKAAAQELKNTIRSCAKKIKNARGGFGREIRIFRQIRHIIESKAETTTTESVNNKPAGETP